VNGPIYDTPPNLNVVYLDLGQSKRTIVYGYIMQRVCSFDIFDTLLARTVKDPTDIFNIIEEKFPYPKFKELRIRSQSNSTHLIEDIYRHFKLLTNDTDEVISQLRQFELKTEMENTIPIVSNILKIQNGDILVSDMYLSHEEILKLLKYHYINQNIQLFVSSSGKSQGYMWASLIKNFDILNHTGDNYHSDITMSSKFGIKGTYTQIHKFSKLEEKLDTNRDLMIFLRRFRLMNPYDETTFEYKLYDYQIQYNIPLLLFMCKKIYTILTSEHRNKVLFLSRDGCLIYKLFSFLYPQFKSYYVYSSRLINKTYTDNYVAYLKEIFNDSDSLLFDLHGSFNSGRKLFMEVFNCLPRILIFDLSIKTNCYDKLSYFTHHSNMIETFNQDLNGSLIDYKDNKTIHMPTETPLEHIKVMHNTVEEFIHYIKDKSLITENPIFDDDIFWKDYYTNVVSQVQIIAYNIADHEETTLTSRANKYKSDTGDEYACAHKYTIKYQEIISDLLYEKSKKNQLNKIDLLEIGLNRDNVNTIPSLMIWNDYFNRNIQITGFDINSSFLKFNSLYKNIDIIIGDQSNTRDLQQLRMKTYDIIIDDGYHASKHQQISFKTLWQTIKYGGIYIIEDLHYQPVVETCMKTKYLFEEWKKGNWIESDYIKNDDIQTIKQEIESIQFYNSHSKKWGDTVKNAFVYIQKVAKYGKSVN